ncbi:MAG: hypothetical protein R3D00_07035 [Bacteroidia bacterium]
MSMRFVLFALPYLLGMQGILAQAPVPVPDDSAHFTASLPYPVRDNLYYDNSDKTLSQIRLDAGDGLGFRTISLNESLNAQYPTGGEKILRLRLSFTDGTVRECG